MRLCALHDKGGVEIFRNPPKDPQLHAVLSKQRSNGKTDTASRHRSTQDCSELVAPRQCKGRLVNLFIKEVFVHVKTLMT